MAGALEVALARHRAISILALATLTLLAWCWLLAGAGTGMDPVFLLAPPETPGGMHHDMAEMPMQWPLWRVGATFSMWWIMMVAMMLPSAAPTILLYARAAAHDRRAGAPATGSFLAGYLLAWGVFSLIAAMSQIGLEQSGLVDAMAMTSRNRVLSAAILIGVGIYQLSPIKDVCLRHCRNPASFLAAHFRPGAAGALRMGLRHGSYCVGCCWLLMALLFTVGIMNLAWIALLTVLVASEKLLPFGRALSFTAGLGCIAWGGAILLS